MKKYPFLIIALIILVVSASGCITNNNTSNQTKTYSQNGTYFIYNGTWEVANTTSDNAIAAVGDPNNVNPQTHQPETFIIIQELNVTNGTSLQTAYNQNYVNFFNNTTNVHVSESNITIKNNTALENIYTSTSNGVESKMMAVWFSQNNQIYVILCGSPASNFDNEQNDFNLVINSFTAQ